MANDNIDKGRFDVFYENASRGIFYQLTIATLLTFILWHNHIPPAICLGWLGIIIFLNAIRVLLLKVFHHTKLYQRRPGLTLLSFILILFILGVTWGMPYLFLLTHPSAMPERLVVLILGGMAIGGIPSLAPYLSVYLAYVLPMLLPIILRHTLLFDFDHTIFSSMLIIFLAMLVFTALHFHKLMMRTLSLDKKQGELVRELSRSNEQLKSAYIEIKKISRTDYLTGLANRLFFDETLEIEWKRAIREKTELSLLLIDIDNFKVMNDSFGHPEGDRYLKTIATLLLTAARRPGDFLARIGGDEFAIILPNTTLKNAAIIAENLRNSIFEYNQKNYENKNLSICIGLSNNAMNSSTEMLVCAADKYLYEAKSRGKNQVFSAQS